MCKTILPLLVCVLFLTSCTTFTGDHPFGKWQCNSPFLVWDIDPTNSDGLHQTGEIKIGDEIIPLTVYLSSFSFSLDAYEKDESDHNVNEIFWWYKMENGKLVYKITSTTFESLEEYKTITFELIEDYSEKTAEVAGENDYPLNDFETVAFLFA
jgi:hypothetical protein